MANKSTGITLRLTAVDATSRAFKNVASSAANVTASIAKWGAGAAAVAAGAFAITANKLSKLSDVAQSAGATTEEITKLSGALQILGVKGSAPEDLATAFQRMTKTTGQVGVEGFHNMISEISKLPTITERSEAAMKVFGRSGLNFLPIIEGAARETEAAMSGISGAAEEVGTKVEGAAQNGVGALKAVEAGIPGISQAAADAGDRFSDAMTVMKLGASKVWNEGLMKVAELISGQFTGDVRTAAMVCAAQMEYFAKAAWAYLKPFITDTKAAFLQLAEWISRVMHNTLTIIGGIIVTSLENAWARAKNVLDDIGRGAKLIIADLKGDKAEHDRIIAESRAAEKALDLKTSDNWMQTFKTFEEQLKWDLGDGPLGNVDLTALKAQRDAQVEAAIKAGEAVGKAAVKIAADELGKIGGGASRGKASAENKNPELILGGTYKAITYAMRAGYATAQEKIAKGVDKIAGLLKGVKENTEAMADNLDLGVLNG